MSYRNNSTSHLIPISRILKYILAFFTFVFFASSCVVYSARKNLKLNEGDPSRQDRMEGLSDLLARKNPGETLHVFVVHGMQTHGPNAYDKVIGKLAKLMDLKMLWSEIYNVPEMGNHMTHSFQLYSTKFNEMPSLKLYKYKSNDDKFVQFTFVQWSPLTRIYKDQLKQVDRNDLRVGVNEQLKFNIMNDGFGDVAAVSDEEVQRKVGNLLEIAMRLQFVDIEELRSKETGCQIMLHDDPDLMQDVAIISASFGSKITLEFLTNIYAWTKARNELNAKFEKPYYTKYKSNKFYENKLSEFMYMYSLSGKKLCIGDFNLSQSKALENIINNSQIHWYSFSNQLVLLRGFRYDFGALDKLAQIYQNQRLLDVESDFIDVEDEFYRDKKIADSIFQRNVQLNSFFDPNDLLGYKLPDALSQAHNNVLFDKANNISLPIAKVMYLDLVANPMKAHYGAKDNPYVLQIMAKGWNGDYKELGKRRDIIKKLKNWDL